MELLPPVSSSSIARVVESCLLIGVRQATFYYHPKEIVRATRRFQPRRQDRTVEVVLTIGQPNSRERRFIALRKKAGEPFPVRKLQLEWFKKRRPT